MSERDIESIRAAFEAFNGGDYDAALAFADPEVVFEPPTDMPEVQLFHGREGARRFWSMMLDVFDVFQSEPEEVSELGEGRYLVMLRERFRLKGGGADVVEQNAALFTMRDGRMTRVQVFTDRAQALES